MNSIRILIIGCSLFLTSCSKVNLSNYEKLKSGMDYAEVITLIGEPTQCTETFGTRSCIWGSKEGAHIKANFLGGAAVLFSYKNL